MDPKTAKKLRTLVYAGLAGGLVGVSSMSAVAHGNASSHGGTGTGGDPVGAQLEWEADDFVVVDNEKQKAAPTK